MIITALLPGGTQVELTIAPDTLVYNGDVFVNPSYLTYIELYTIPVDALTLPFREQQEMALQTSVRIKALVISRNSTVVPTTDPAVVAVPDPSLGQCICGLTCTGTDLRFVTVTVETP